MSHPLDIAIIGAGAAGLAAAIFAAEAAPSLRIAMFDGAKSVGAKILVSGGGRCNVTHDRVTAKDFNATGHFVRHVLAAFDEKATVRWFDSLGVPLKREETGKLFPVSDSARTVLAALLRRCAQLGVTLCEDHRVSDIRQEPSPDVAALSRFTVQHSHGQSTARSVIMATGGRSLPKTGSDGGGWIIAQRLGHTLTPTHPALAPLLLDESFFHASISGLALDVELSTFAHDAVGPAVPANEQHLRQADRQRPAEPALRKSSPPAPPSPAKPGKLIDRRAGSLLFTHFGISGPVVMDASRHWVIAHEQGRAPSLLCSFLPGESFDAVERWLIDLASAAPRRTVVAALATKLPRGLAEALPRFVAIDAAAPLSQLPRDRRRALVHALTQLPLPVTRDRGWNYAEVTAGGVPLSEVRPQDMASRLVPGLFLCGEMLDCDGRIGGFNFQWAWATGCLAGRGAANQSPP